MNQSDSTMTPTRTPRGARGAGHVLRRLGVRRRAVAMVLALVAVVGGGAMVQTTSAAWVNDAYGRTAVTTGSWTSAVSFGTCVVRNKNDNATGRTCTVTEMRAVEFNDSHPVGDRTANMYFKVSAPQAKSGDDFEVTLDLRTATGLPANWVWSTSGVGPGNLTAFTGFACASLPTLKAYAPDWASSGGDVFFVLYEQRVGRSGMACAP